MIKENSFNKDDFEFLFEMEQHHFWHLGRKEIIYALLQRIYRNRLPNITMVEIGCGNGSVLQFLNSKGVNIEGGDLFLEALQFCRSRVDVPLYQLDACNTPFADEQYDVVGLFDVIEHINDDEKVLKEAYRICKLGGRVILTVPANRWLWSYFDVMSCHKRRYSKKELHQKLRGAGFVVEKISFYMFFLFPVFSLYRAVESMRFSSNDKELSSRAEVQTVPLVNEVFLGILRLEKLLIKGTNLPLGTSLVFMA
ncbi:class I SAM-dependent methyltransferase [Candidatus Poribacteria bacterium]